MKHYFESNVTETLVTINGNFIVAAGCGLNGMILKLGWFKGEEGHTEAWSEIPFGLRG